MFKWLTRKNRWYTLCLMVAQLSLGIVWLNRGDLLLGGFFIWASGVNTMYFTHPSVAPDQL